MSARDIRHDEGITNAVFASLKDYGMTVDVEAFHAALAAAGLAVVPREASVSMIGAGVIAALEARKTKPEGMMELGSDLMAGYRAMIAAATRSGAGGGG